MKGKKGYTAPIGGGKAVRDVTATKGVAPSSRSANLKSGGRMRGRGR